MSRDDKDGEYQCMVDFINASVNLRYADKENISIIKNQNIYKNHRESDGTHLTKFGTSILASNIKRGVAKVFGIPIVKRTRVNNTTTNNKNNRYSH